MGCPQRQRLHPEGLLLAIALGGLSLAPSAQAGPLARRAQERRACQEFAGKLQQASTNPAAAQQVYQQGVLALVARFGENPCTDIPAPAAAAAPAAPPAGAATANPAPAPAGSTPASSAPASGSHSAGSAATGTPPPASAQQQQACQQFAARLQAAAASGGAAAAQQTYTKGIQTLSGMYGANPCPAIRPPQ